MTIRIIAAIVATIVGINVSWIFNMIRNIFRNFANKLRGIFSKPKPSPLVVTVEIPTPDIIRPSRDAQRRARVPKVVRLLRTRQGETSGDRYV